MSELAAQKLKRLIREEENRLARTARKVRISKKMATDLLGMNNPKWITAIGGDLNSAADEDFCDKIVTEFSKNGIMGANSKHVARAIGCMIEVTTDFKAPEVEIIEFIPE